MYLTSIVLTYCTNRQHLAYVPKDTNTLLFSMNGSNNISMQIQFHFSNHLQEFSHRVDRWTNRGYKCEDSMAP